MEASVVIPALNEEEFIGDCLRSLRAQTLPPDEIIVMDNGSTDRTVEIAEELADRVIIMPGVGIADLRQAGAEAAKNPIIVSTDADTTYPIFWLEKLLRHFSDPNIVAVGGPIIPSMQGTVKDLYAKGLSASASAGLFSGANMAYRRDIMLKAGGYAKIRRGEDWELATRLRRYGRIIFDPEAYVYTDIPFSRQLEFANIAWNAGLLGIGIATNNPMSIGTSSGYFIATLGTAIDQVPDGIHHSQIALAGLALTTVFKGAMPKRIYRYLMGLFIGILGHHFFTEDIFNPIWFGINGPIFTAIVLLLAST